MKPRLPITFAVLLVLLMGCAQTPTTQAETGPIKIGFSGPLTGSLVSWGEPDKNGVALAVSEINAAGGVNGRLIEVIYEDDQCDPKTAATVANKLVTIDRVAAIIGTICSGTTLAAAPIAEQNGVVLISVGSSNPTITTAGDYIFRVWPSDSFQGDILSKHLWAEGYRKTALLVANSDYAVGVQEVFSKEYAALGGEVVATERYAVGATDFKTELTKIKAANPDAILVVQHDEAPVIHKQMRELGLSQQAFGTETYDAAPLIEAGKGALDGVIYSMPAFNEDAEVEAFKERYMAAFGKYPEQTIVAAYSYDIMHIVAGCLENDASSQALKDCLYTVQNYDGVGGTITFDQNGDVIREFNFKRIEGGVSTVLS